MVKMKRVITALRRSGSTNSRAAPATQDPPGRTAIQNPAPASNPTDAPPSSGAAYVIDDTPEVNIRRAIMNFCESGGDSGPQAGDEVLYLPPIVDAAECSPTAAKEASTIIRKFLDMKHASKPYVQYNAIMIMRILADNPGKTFTRNLDTKFADKVKDLLKHGKDQSVRQLLAETLEHFEVTKKEDEGLTLLREVWAKQKAAMAKYQPPPAMYQPTPPPLAQHPPPPPPLQFTGASLPPLEELVGRISEAQTSAKLLHQLLASTPRNEVLKNDLVKEFVHRCKSASQSMQDLITCDSPSPDQDTLQTLIETNDILRIALARYQAIKDAHEMQQYQNQYDAFASRNSGDENIMASAESSSLGQGNRHTNLQDPFGDHNQDVPPLSLDELSLNDGPESSNIRPPPQLPPKIDTGDTRHDAITGQEVSPLTPGASKEYTHITYRY